jgi:CubicO group peptidase (beta-lactamase class C family)
VLAQSEQFRNEVEKILKNEVQVDFDIVPSFILLVQDQHQFEFADTFGHALPGDHLNSSFWELGSLSKPVVAFFAERALGSLGLSVDDSMCSILPDSLCHDGWAKVTVRQVIEHQAGLPWITNQMALQEKDVNDPYATYDLESLILDIQQTNPVPGKFAFSHLGYAAFHWLFERVGGLNYFSDATLFTLEQGEFASNMADSMMVMGHGLNGKETPPWHANALIPAVGLKSDIYSMYHFMELFSAQLPKEEYVMNHAMKKELARHDKMKTYKVVQGWFVFRSGKSLVFFHTGHSGGHYVSAAFIPEDDQYAIVFSNGVAGTQGLVLSVLGMLQRAKKR